MHGLLSAKKKSRCSLDCFLLFIRELQLKWFLPKMYARTVIYPLAFDFCSSGRLLHTPITVFISSTFKTIKLNVLPKQFSVAGFFALKMFLHAVKTFFSDGKFLH